MSEELMPGDLYFVSFLTLHDYDHWRWFINTYGEDLLQSGPHKKQDLLYQQRLAENTFSRILLAREFAQPEQMVGTASVHAVYTGRMGVGYIENVLVRSDMRGQGVGHFLMEHVLKNAQDGLSPPLSRLRLVCEPHRERARKMYMSFGFVLEEGSDRHFQLNF